METLKQYEEWLAGLINDNFTLMSELGSNQFLRRYHQGKFDAFYIARAKILEVMNHSDSRKA